MAILEERGLLWWSDEPIPEGKFAPEASITGLLTIDEDGRITLELDGYFPNRSFPIKYSFVEVGLLDKETLEPDTPKVPR